MGAQPLLDEFFFAAFGIGVLLFLVGLSTDMLTSEGVLGLPVKAANLFQPVWVGGALFALLAVMPSYQFSQLVIAFFLVVVCPAMAALYAYFAVDTITSICLDASVAANLSTSSHALQEALLTLLEPYPFAPQQRAGDSWDAWAGLRPRSRIALRRSPLPDESPRAYPGGGKLPSREAPHCERLYPAWTERTMLPVLVALVSGTTPTSSHRINIRMSLVELKVVCSPASSAFPGSAS